MEHAWNVEKSGVTFRRRHGSGFDRGHAGRPGRFQSRADLGHPRPACLPLVGCARHGMAHFLTAPSQ